MRRIRLRAHVLKLSTHPRVELAIHGLLVAALVPAFIWLAPASRWDQPGLLLRADRPGVIADFNEITLPGGLRFDAGLPLALITLAVLGPLPALLVDLVPIAVGGLVRREQIIRPGNLANLAAYGWETVAAAALLAAAGVVGAGLRGAAVAAARRRGHVRRELRDRLGASTCRSTSASRRRALPRMFFDAVPDRAGMVVLAALTAVLVGPLGVLGLALFALIAVLPQTALTSPRARARSAALDPLTATRRYAHALALHLGLDRAERRHLARVTELAFARRADAGDPIAYARQTLRDPAARPGRPATSASGGTAAAARPACAAR